MFDRRLRLCAATQWSPPNEGHGLPLQGYRISIEWTCVTGRAVQKYIPGSASTGCSDDAARPAGIRLTLDTEGRLAETPL